MIFIRYIYYTLRFIFFLLLFLGIVLIFSLEHPAMVVKALKKPLASLDISIGNIEGNPFKGLDIRDINYQNKVKLDRAKLKINWDSLKNKTLEIEDLKLKDIYIKEQFLASLLKGDSKPKEKSNTPLPIDIDRVILKRGEISFKSVKYQNGEIGKFNLNLDGLDLRVDLNSSSPLKSVKLRDLNLSSNRLLYQDFKLNRADINLKDIDIKLLDRVLFGRVYLLVDDFKYPKYRLKYSKVDLNNLDLSLDLNSTKSPIKSLKVDGLNTLIDTLQYEKLKLNFGKVYLDRIGVREYLKSVDLNRADIKIKGFDYLDTKLKNSNLNLNSLIVNLEDNLSLLEISLKKSNLLVEGGKYQEYNINYGDLKLNGAWSNLKDYKSGLSLKLKSNIANGDINGVVQNSHINLKGDITPKSSYLARFLKDSGIKLKKDATIHIFKLKGDYKKDLDFNLKLDNLSLVKDEYKIDSRRLKALGTYSIEKNALKLKLDTILNSNIGKLSLRGDTSLDLDDINSTLKYNLKSKINIKRGFLAKYLEGIDLNRLSTINLNLSGDLKNTTYRVSSSNISIKKDDISLKTPIVLSGNVSPLKGNIKYRFYSKPNSNLGGGVLRDSGEFNFRDFNSTFKHKTTLDITPNRDYINRFLKEQNITLLKSPNIKGVVSGDLSNINTSLKNTNLKLLYQKSILDLNLNIPQLNFNLKTSNIKGKLDAKADSDIIKLKLNSKFSGNIKKIENINSNNHIKIEKFKGFGVNLTPLVPIDIDLKTKNRRADFKLNSNRLNIYGKSKNFDEISLKIKSKRLYLYKIVSLPPELEHKYIMLDLNLDAKLSTKYIDLNGDIHSNKKFKAYIKVLNSKSKKFNARINTKHLNLLARGNLETKNIIATLNIDSIEELQKEIAKVYNFKIANVDGKLKAKLILQGDKGSFKINSPKLELNGFNIEDIAFDAKYEKKLITLNRLTWRVTGFSDNKFNKKFYLTKKGKIYLGDKRYIDIQIYPNISIEAKEGVDGLNGKLKMIKVPIAHPDYGSAFLSCNISYHEENNQREINGDINIKYMQIFYEAKFLEADYDPDIIVISRKNKRIKDKLENNDFFKNTKIDLSLRAYQANYRTPDIDLTFDINLNIYKEFGKNVTILGKIEDINGHFDQTPKRFLIKNSNIVFQGGEEINPLLDIRVEYELPQVLIEIYIGGYANRPKIEFSSEPPMPKKDIMSYLLFGTSTKKLTDGEGSLSREAELFILNQLARDLAYELKLDRLFIKDDGTGEGYAVEVGKRVGKRNMVIIESSKAGNSYIIERDISKHLKLRVGEHLKEHQSQSIDIFFRKKFK